MGTQVRVVHLSSYPAGPCTFYKTSGDARDQGEVQTTAWPVSLTDSDRAGLFARYQQGFRLYLDAKGTLAVYLAEPVK